MCGAWRAEPPVFRLLDTRLLDQAAQRRRHLEPATPDLAVADAANARLRRFANAFAPAASALRPADACGKRACQPTYSERWRTLENRKRAHADENHEHKRCGSGSEQHAAELGGALGGSATVKPFIGGQDHQLRRFGRTALTLRSVAPVCGGLVAVPLAYAGQLVV